ncbi:MAG: RNA polymerase sigma factor [Bacteroidetes bacterium]|nr:RNA polymerase sigma factor [Bacteroidota bacterium]
MVEIIKDFELIKKAQKGDMQAFEELLYKYDRAVMNIAASYRNDEEDAKDIYQEVFMRVFKGIKTFRFNSEFSTWLFRITANVCVSFHHSKKRHHFESIDKTIGYENDFSTPVSETIDSGLQTDSLAIDEEMSRHIDAALKELPPQQKLVFTLKFYEGYKIREIAEMMNCNDGTIKRYLFTATNRMRDKLKTLAE